MLQRMNKATLYVSAMGMALVLSNPVLANSQRILQSQGEYAKTAGDLWIIALKALLFLAGIAAIGFSAWHLLQDYVFAKSDHEKKFSIGKLIVGAVVGSIMCYPGGAALIGSDFTGTGQEVDIVQEDFVK